MLQTPKFRLAVGIALVLLGARVHAGELQVADSDQLKEALRRAEPGTRVLMAPGQYRGDVYIENVHGRADAMIELLALDPNRPPRFSGGDYAFQLASCSYLVVDGLIAERARVNNFQVAHSHHLVLRRIDARAISGKGNCDGLKLPDVTDFLIHRCTISGWGDEGSAIDMVGCARGVVLECQISAPNPGGQTANGIQIKGGSHSVGVFRCRFQDTRHRALQIGGRTGRAYFHRDNFDAGYEAIDIIACSNLFVGGESALAFASCTRSAALYNTILRPQRYIARLLKEGEVHPPRDNVFSHNLILRGEFPQAINIGGGVSADAVSFESNYWYHPDRPDRSLPELPGGQTGSSGGQDPRLDSSYKPLVDGPAADYGAHADGAVTVWDEATAKFPWAWRQAQEHAERR